MRTAKTLSETKCLRPGRRRSSSGHTGIDDMKNKLVDLNNHLFTQLERLNEEDISGEDLDKEIKRADAIAKVAMQIIESSSVTLRAAGLIAEYGGNLDSISALIIGENASHTGPKLIAGKGK